MVVDLVVQYEMRMGYEIRLSLLEVAAEILTAGRLMNLALDLMVRIADSEVVSDKVQRQYVQYLDLASKHDNR